MRNWVVKLTTGVVGAAIGAGAIYLSSDAFLYGGREHIDLESWVEPGDAWTERMMPAARWATAELCGAELPCMQAVQAETLTMYRFDDREDAVAAAREFAGEAYLSGWIVVRFEPDALTAAERREFAYSLDCINVGVAEGGLEC
ncbi:hypothetical protein [Geodermatophilus sp. FMUSA9-8]|uniref:hypothetical protein n=1 Tax=Geodermatophilus sp. FMUSA9-8 TaxID=3120155 RepID=UPI00300B766E